MDLNYHTKSKALRQWAFGRAEVVNLKILEVGKPSTHSTLRNLYITLRFSTRVNLLS